MSESRLEGSSADPFGRSDREWTQTFTGRQFWPLQPRPEEVVIEDVAHALSLQCRYTGHCRTFYSVAQHSVLVSRLAPAGEDPLWGLMHDAAEAYLTDVARPLKHSIFFAAYRSAEATLMGVICERFGLPVEEPAWVKPADNVLLATERRDLMAPPPRPWSPGPGPMLERIQPWTPRLAEALFLNRFSELVEPETKITGVYPRHGGPERCPTGTCSECVGPHHFSEATLGNAEDEPHHPAACAGLTHWYECKHCEAWTEDADA